MEELFLCYDYKKHEHIIDNNIEYISFRKKSNELEDYEITNYNKNYSLKIPIKNSVYSLRTNLKKTEKILTFLKNHLEYNKK